MTQQFNLSQPLIGGVALNEYRPKLQQNYDKNGRIYYTDENGEIVAPHQLPYFERLGRRIKGFGTNLSSWLNNENPESEDYKQKVALGAGLLTLPFGGEGFAASKVGTGLLGKLTPFLGKKISQNVVQGMGAGGASGLVEGGIRGVAEGENPVVTALQDGTIGLLGGGAFGLGIGKLGQGMAKRGLQGNGAAQAQYYDDYIEGLAHPQKAMADFRGAKYSFGKGEARSIGDIIVDESGKPLTFYHGTDEVFDNFIPKGTYDFEPAVYFTDNKKVAKTYTHTNNVKERYLDLENPLEVDAGGRTYNEYYDQLKSDFNNALNNKHDGIIIKNIIDDNLQNSKTKIKSNEYIVFDTSKIKKKNDLFNNIVDDEEFDYNKAKQLAKDLKSGKNNPLKNTENSVKIRNIEGISKSDMDYLTHELNNNLTKKGRTKKIIKKPVGDYVYKVKNKGFNEYEFIEGKPIDDIYN